MFDSDPVIRKLLEKSHFPTAQLETLLIYSRVSGMNYEKQAKMRNRQVSKGAYVRTLTQAKLNLIRTIYRLILLNCLGVIDDEALQSMLSISSTLSKLRKQGVNATIEEAEEILRAADMIIGSLINVTSQRKIF